MLDSRGHAVAFEREDGASNMRWQIGFGKAHGAHAFGMGSRSLGRRAEGQPTFIAAATSATGGALSPSQRSAHTRQRREDRRERGRHRRHIGNDEEAALAGIETVGFTADTG